MDMCVCGDQSWQWRASGASTFSVCSSAEGPWHSKLSVADESSQI